MVRVGGHIKRLREERGWSQPRLAVEAGVAVSAVSQIENGRRSPNVSTLDKLAEAFRVEVADFFPKARSSSLEPPLFYGPEDEQRAEATGRSEEERIGISNALVETIEQLNTGYRGALEELSSSSVDEIFALYMQASLSYVGVTTIADDAEYSIDDEDDSTAEREAKIKMRSALDKMGQTVDELEKVMTAAEAKEELPEGVASLARYQMRRAV